MRTKADLQALQALPLDIKVSLTIDRIRQWIDEYGEGGVYVSFSGGKDSTVLLHLVRSLYPKVRAAFSDTGLEFPEIRNFVKTFDNVDIIRPKMTFRDIVTQHGYPLFGKEISEAIRFARKIGGGDSPTQTSRNQRSKEMQRKRIEICGERSYKGFLIGARTGTSRFSIKKNTCLRAVNFPS